MAKGCSGCLGVLIVAALIAAAGPTACFIIGALLVFGGFGSLKDGRRNPFTGLGMAAFGGFLVLIGFGLKSGPSPTPAAPVTPVHRQGIGSPAPSAGARSTPSRPRVAPSHPTPRSATARTLPKEKVLSQREIDQTLGIDSEKAEAESLRREAKFQAEYPERVRAREEAQREAWLRERAAESFDGGYGGGGRWRVSKKPKKGSSTSLFGGKKKGKRK